MRYNQTSLDKIEKVLDEAGYVVRYERGNFQFYPVKSDCISLPKSPL